MQKILEGNEQRVLATASQIYHRLQRLNFEDPNLDHQNRKQQNALMRANWKRAVSKALDKAKLFGNARGELAKKLYRVGGAAGGNSAYLSWVQPKLF